VDGKILHETSHGIAPWHESDAPSTLLLRLTERQSHAIRVEAVDQRVGHGAVFGHLEARRHFDTSVGWATARRVVAEVGLRLVRVLALGFACGSRVPSG